MSCKNNKMPNLKGVFFHSEINPAAQKLARVAIRKGDGDRLHEALKKGAQINVFDRPLLLEAARYAGREIAYNLLINGAWIDLTNPNGETPIHITARLGKRELMNFFIDCDLKIDPRTKLGTTPLMEAVFHAQWETLTLLVDRGADVNAKDQADKNVVDQISLGKRYLKWKKDHCLKKLKTLYESGQLNPKKWELILAQEALWTKGIEEKYQFIQTYLKKKGALGIDGPVELQREPEKLTLSCVA
jgi:hypothetical protein